jgi:hypothetical protein
VSRSSYLFTSESVSEGHRKSALPMSEPRAAAIAIVPIWNSWRHNRASCVGGNLATRITSDLCSRGPWGAGSAMSSRCRGAAPTIVPFTGAAMSRHGGRPLASTRSRLRTGCGSTPGWMAHPSKSTSIPCSAHRRSAERTTAELRCPQDLATDAWQQFSGEPMHQTRPTRRWCYTSR